SKSAVETERVPVFRKRRLQWIAAWAVAVVVVLVMAIFLWQSRHSASSPVDSASPRAIAVLPFQNAGSDKATDFLRLDLPDEVATSEKIAMREQITSRVREGLVPVLGGSSVSGEAGTRPKSEEAYDLYLRSIAVPHDVAPTKDAIAMLERAVGIDPTYAPAWEALGLRYYWDSAYGDGGEPMLKRSDSAFERALALDPNLISAAG